MVVCKPGASRVGGIVIPPRAGWRGSSITTHSTARPPGLVKDRAFPIVAGASSLHVIPAVGAGTGGAGRRGFGSEYKVYALISQWPMVAGCKGWHHSHIKQRVRRDGTTAHTIIPSNATSRSSTTSATKAHHQWPRNPRREPPQEPGTTPKHQGPRGGPTQGIRTTGELTSPRPVIELVPPLPRKKQNMFLTHSASW